MVSCLLDFFAFWSGKCACDLCFVRTYLRLCGCYLDYLSVVTWIVWRTVVWFACCFVYSCFSSIVCQVIRKLRNWSLFRLHYSSWVRLLSGLFDSCCLLHFVGRWMICLLLILFYIWLVRLNEYLIIRKLFILRMRCTLMLYVRSFVWSCVVSIVRHFRCVSFGG